MIPPAKNMSEQSVAPDFFSRQVSQARRFFLELAPAKKRGLTIVCGGRESCNPDYAIHRKTFPFYSLEYVVAGHGTVVLQGRRHSLQPGVIFSYGPDIAQDIATDSGEPLKKYFVDFAGTAALRLLRLCKLLPGTATRIHPPGALQGIFDEMIQSGLSGTRHAPEVCAKLLECLAMRAAESRAPLQGAETRSFVTYQHCRQHIEQHFLRLKTLRQIADECHSDAAYLCRLFRRYDHQSPYRHLLRLKLNFAAEHLHQPGALVKQVAEDAGFGDPFHFSRTFKNVFGLSPDAFRKLRGNAPS
jgi:AraC-like DNA-binding protein